MIAPQLPDEADLASATARYERERAKRVDPHRAEAISLTGAWERYKDDPYTQPSHREPIRSQDEVIIVGAGLGGLLVAAKLREANVEKIRIIDPAGDVGGVWYWNRYPGVMCDIESYIYMPLLEELDCIPSQKYAPGSEIFEHTRAIAKRYDLYDEGLFQTTVTGAAWDAEQQSWTVATDRGDDLHSQFLVLAVGTLRRPRLPAIPGIEKFRGRMFHTSRWDFEYTGGDANGNLSRLVDKDVAVIGTGATAIQCVPHVGRWARNLYVVQRTPSTVSERNNRPTEPEFVESLKPSWQMERMWNFTRLAEGRYAPVDLVDDGWTQSYHDLASIPGYADLPKTEAAKVRELADLARMEQIRERVSKTVAQPATAERLKPYYPFACKRPCFHDDYLATFNRDNVHVVDTEGRGVEEIFEDGFAVNGERYAADCLIFATGFMLGDLTSQIDLPVANEHGITLQDKWQGRLSTMHGIMTSGFPNLFFLPCKDSQSAPAANTTHLLYETAEHITHIVTELRERQCRVFEVSSEGEQAWVDRILEKRIDNLAFLESCTPGRWNNEGRPGEKPIQNTDYGEGFTGLAEVLAQWRRDRQLAGLVTR